VRTILKKIRYFRLSKPIDQSVSCGNQEESILLIDLPVKIIWEGEISQGKLKGEVSLYS